MFHQASSWQKVTTKLEKALYMSNHSLSYTLLLEGLDITQGKPIEFLYLFDLRIREQILQKEGGVESNML